MPNRLQSASSPYLRQHAGNPVDWYPWCDEAFERARREDKPIFLSIGYSACHWCHVMAHESFEDDKTAELLNRHFVCIKVDREERPDLDQIYMAAVVALTGSGGWPMSVFITAEGVPFFGGTYFPPRRRYGMPSFAEILLAIADAWQNRRDELLDGGQQVVKAIEAQNAPPSGGGPDLIPSTLEQALSQLEAQFDATFGGWGNAPKFPQPMVLDFLLARLAQGRDERVWRMVKRTLEAMARGGMYDQLGGGFHRYAVDRNWQTPHFEKMLYDNAQLARVYLHAWQIDGDPFYRAIVEETLDWMAREMLDPAGGFYATLDADSEGEEGKFYTWTADEVRAVLGEQAEAFMRAYEVTPRGNFEGKTVLQFRAGWAERVAWGGARERLVEARRRRVAPACDTQVLTAWNGLALAAFAEAARVLDNGRYLTIAERNAEFALTHLRAASGHLWHLWADRQAGIAGYLQDYACLIEGLIELYQTTFDSRWYRAAVELVEVMLARFDADGLLYDTDADQPILIIRPREVQDNAVPSGNAMAVRVLLRLSSLAVDPRYAEIARRLLAPMQRLMAGYPLGFGQWLGAFALATGVPVTVALVGDPDAADTRALLQVCRGRYNPQMLVAVGRPGDADVPLLRYRDRSGGRATAHVCIGTVCKPPVVEAADLQTLLAGAVYPSPAA